MPNTSVIGRKSQQELNVLNRAKLCGLHEVRLSKSRFLSGHQCLLRLWYDYHDSKLASEPDENQQWIFDTGHEVGELACERHPEGRLLSQDHRHFEEAIEETDKLIADDSIPALFEPAFDFEGLIARVDILERLPENRWRAIEVKSTSKPNPTHVLDLAFQLHILKESGLDVQDAGILTLDTAYVYNGETLDVDQLFKFHDCLDEAQDLIEDIVEQTQEMKEVIASDEAPHIATGEHCRKPYPCPYYNHCSSKITEPEPDHPISELPALNAIKKEELESNNITEIRDIPGSFKLTKLQSIVHRAVKGNRNVIYRRRLAKIKNLEEPIYHLDFETISTAIPRFAGTSPFSTIPFQFSVHKELGESPPRHSEYLHEDDSDPRSQLVDELIQALGGSGSICVYSPYETRVIGDLIRALPERADELAAIRNRLFDLFKFIKGSVYMPEFRGSFSLKTVYPALCPGESYDDLAIAGGRTASTRYLTALKSDDDGFRQQVFADLRLYCKQDTLATYKVRQALLKLAQPAKS